MILPSGEKFQELCDVYIGEQSDFEYNPKILAQKDKQLYIHNIPDNYNNPKLVFCYTHLIEKLYEQLAKFKNPFVLISHNSDYIITDSHKYIGDSPKIIHWFTQNLGTTHPKISFIPIGIANSCWPHGNEINFKNILANPINKQFTVYFNFKVQTNKEKRQPCKDILETTGLQFIPTLPPDAYLDLLSQHNFSICPEGNGIDSHRIWESILLKTIPIMLRNPFTEIIAKEYPCILLDKWEDLNNDTFNYNNNNIVFPSIDFTYFKNKILSLL
jgi:hypothetical protein